MNPKYQIFISSTYEDLKDEREQVLKSILRLGHIPIGMELFNAANDTQWQMIKRRIEESDYYIVILASRYGSIDEETGLSYTEKEYDYATELGVPTMAFVLERAASWPGDRADKEPEKRPLLESFINKVQKKMRDSWSNKDELASRVAYALTEMTTAQPRIGWVRATEAASPEMASELALLSKENRELRDQLAASQAITLMPKMELTAWIGWDSWPDSPSGFGEKARLKQGYRLHIQLTNNGNLICHAATATIAFPLTILSTITPKMLDRSPKGIYRERLHLIGLDIKGGLDNWVATPLLPGQFKEEKFNLADDAVEAQTDWKIVYSIHPEQGYATEGEIFFDQIEIRSRKPPAPPAPDSIE